MKLLDDKKRLFGIVNPVDLLVVLALLAVAFVVASVLFDLRAPKPTAGGSTTVRTTILAGAVREFDPKSVRPGDPAQRKGGGALGKVVAVRVQPAIEEVATSDGKLVKVTSPFLQDVFVTIEGPGDITASTAFMGNEPLRTNAEFDLQTPLFEAAKAKVVSISKAK